MEKVTLKPDAKTLLLLGLWDLGGLNAPIAKTKVLELVKKKGEKVADYAAVMEQLKEKGAIAVSGKVAAPKWELTQAGLALLTVGLQDESFGFAGATVRTTTTNALLRWLRQMGGSVAAPVATVAKVVDTIDSYEAFKVVALETFDKLNRDFNLDNLVPIYRIRREIGERVERSDFTTWLLKMQSSDILQLSEGSVEDSAPGKIEDSVTTPLGKLRCYAKRIA